MQSSWQEAPQILGVLGRAVPPLWTWDEWEMLTGPMGTLPLYHCLWSENQGGEHSWGSDILSIPQYLLR